MSSAAADFAPTTDFASARDQAHEWRGACLNTFAEAGYQLGTVLLRAFEEPAYRDVRNTPHLAGQEVQALRTLTERDGPLAKNAESLLAAMDEFARFDELRRLLAQGVLTIAVTEAGDIIYLLRMLRFKNGSADQTTLTLDQSDAEARKNDLGRAAGRLKTQLQTVAKGLNAPAGDIRPVSSSLPANAKNGNGEKRRSLPPIPIQPR